MASLFLVFQKIIKTIKKVVAEEKSPNMYSISGVTINCTLRLTDQWRQDNNFGLSLHIKSKILNHRLNEFFHSQMNMLRGQNLNRLLKFFMYFGAYTSTNRQVSPAPRPKAQSYVKIYLKKCTITFVKFVQKIGQVHFLKSKTTPINVSGVKGMIALHIFDSKKSSFSVNSLYTACSDLSITSLNLRLCKSKY